MVNLNVRGLRFVYNVVSSSWDGEFWNLVDVWSGFLSDDMMIIRLICVNLIFEKGLLCKINFKYCSD